VGRKRWAKPNDSFRCIDWQIYIGRPKLIFGRSIRAMTHTPTGLNCETVFLANSKAHPVRNETPSRWTEVHGPC
jgi:hypothetical protein